MKNELGSLLKRVRANSVCLEVYFRGLKVGSPCSKFFPCRVDSFSEGTWCAGKQTGFRKSFLPCMKWRQLCQVYPVLLPR